MSDGGGPQAPAGWYPDPDDPGRQRYWDGERWTDHTAPGPGSGRAVGGGGGGPAPAPRGADRPGVGGPASTTEAPSTWLWQSIVATVLCCVPAGIVAIVFAAQAQGALNAGDLGLAREKAGRARTWTLVSVAVGVVAILLYAAVVFGGSGAVDPFSPFAMAETSDRPLP